MPSLGVFASIFDATGRLLLVRQAHGSRHWTTPGGRVESRESPLIALAREVMEEIGCEVRVRHLIGVYGKPYRDDVVLSFAAGLLCGAPQPRPPEISDVAFFVREELPSEIAFNTRVRLEDAFEDRRGIVRVFDTANSLASSMLPFDYARDEALTKSQPVKTESRSTDWWPLPH